MQYLLPYGLCLKMIKEDNLGVTNIPYLTLHEADSLHLENCKTGWKAGCFYKIGNKEQEKEK